MARHRETDDEYFRRTGELREGDWGGPEKTRPGLGETLYGVGEDALTDKIADNLVPSRGGSQAKRDADDARNADSAVSAIIGSIASTLMLMPTPAFVVPVAGLPVAVVWGTLVTSAAAATRVAWAKLSQQDRAKIWRGEI